MSNVKIYKERQGTVSRGNEFVFQTTLQVRNTNFSMKL